jgi:cell division protein FtsZ
MLFEVDEAVNRIRAEVDCDANILFGSALLEDMEGRVRVSVVATGIDAESCTGFVADNVQRLHLPRRKTMETEAPVPSSPRMGGETSAMGRTMDNLARQLDTFQMTVPEPVVRNEPAPVIPVPPPKVQMEAPLDLGGMEAPMIEEPVATAAPVRAGASAIQSKWLGLFGRKRVERRDYPVEPRLEQPMPVPRQPAAARPAPSAPPAAPAQTQAASVSPRAAAEALRQQTQSADDLFSGVAEDDRFEIPAFLRRQANSGG